MTPLLSRRLHKQVSGGIVRIGWTKEVLAIYLLNESLILRLSYVIDLHFNQRSLDISLANLNASQKTN